MKLRSKKGFTLMEMLIVVAIIAILIAIAIPAFSASLKKSKQAADNANVRATYSEAMSNYLADDGSNDTVSATTETVMQADYDGKTQIADIDSCSWDKGDYVVVTIDDDGGDSGEIYVTAEGSASK